MLTATADASDDMTKREDCTLTAVDNRWRPARHGEAAREFRKRHTRHSPRYGQRASAGEHATNATPVPARRRKRRPKLAHVVKPDDTVSVQTVTTGPTDGTNTVITRGVAPGDVVVTYGCHG